MKAFARQSPAFEAAQLNQPHHPRRELPQDLTLEDVRGILTIQHPAFMWPVALNFTRNLPLVMVAYLWNARTRATTGSGFHTGVSCSHEAHPFVAVDGRRFPNLEPETREVDYINRTDVDADGESGSLLGSCAGESRRRSKVIRGQVAVLGLNSSEALRGSR